MIRWLPPNKLGMPWKSGKTIGRKRPDRPRRAGSYPSPGRAGLVHPEPRPALGDLLVHRGGLRTDFLQSPGLYLGRERCSSSANTPVYTGSPGHSFLPDQVSLANSPFRPLIIHHQQVTEAHLLTLAHSHLARLATFDREISRLLPSTMSPGIFWRCSAADRRPELPGR